MSLGARWWDSLRWCDRLFLGYMAVTGLLILFRHEHAQLLMPWWMLAVRVIVGAIVILLCLQAGTTRHPLLRFARDFWIPFAMAWLYVETGALNRLVFSQPFDSLLHQADQWLFGKQYSLTLVHDHPGAFLGEFLQFGYFYYYLMFAVVGLGLWFRHRDEAAQFAYQRYLFVIAIVMVPCYLIFVLFPTWGPQFIDKNYSRNLFPGYFFKYCLDVILEHAERPTGAFPSSHAALALASMVFLWRHGRRMYWLSLVPVAALLVATVYLQAHYVIDVLVGGPMGIALGYVAEDLQVRLKDPGLRPTILPASIAPAPVQSPAPGQSPILAARGR